MYSGKQTALAVSRSAALRMYRRWLPITCAVRWARSAWDACTRLATSIIMLVVGLYKYSLTLDPQSNSGGSVLASMCVRHHARSTVCHSLAHNSSSCVLFHSAALHAALVPQRSGSPKARPAVRKHGSVHVKPVHGLAGDRRSRSVRACCMCLCSCHCFCCKWETCVSQCRQPAKDEVAQVSHASEFQMQTSGDRALASSSCEKHEVCKQQPWVQAKSGLTKKKGAGGKFTWGNVLTDDAGGLQVRFVHHEVQRNGRYMCPELHQELCSATFTTQPWRLRFVFALVRSAPHYYMMSRLKVCFEQALDRNDPNYDSDQDAVLREAADSDGSNDEASADMARSHSRIVQVVTQLKADVRSACSSLVSLRCRHRMT